METGFWEKKIFELVSRIRASKVEIRSQISKEKKKWFISLGLEMGHGVLD